MRKKAILDISMEILFLLQMSYHLIDPALHEWLGLLLFIFLILHNILDRRWYTGFGRGTYTAKRIFQTIINFFLLFFCLGMMLSAIFLSTAISNIFHLKVTLLGRKLHIVCTAWSFILMSIHVGTHWNMIASAIKKQLKHPQHWYPLAGKVIGMLLSSYGAYSFLKRELPQRMFLQAEYVFFDYNESLFACLGAYIAIQCLFICLTYCINSICPVLWNKPQNGF